MLKRTAFATGALLLFAISPLLSPAQVPSPYAYVFKISDALR